MEFSPMSIFFQNVGPSPAVGRAGLRWDTKLWENTAHLPPGGRSTGFLPFYTLDGVSAECVLMIVSSKWVGEPDQQTSC